MPSKKERIKVKLLLFATLRDKYGFKEKIIETGETFQDLLESVRREIGEDFVNELFDKEKNKIRDDRIILINGIHAKLKWPNIHLNDGDVVAIFPPIAGG